MNDNTEQKNNARAVQHRRGTAAQNDAFTGLPGEIVVDLDNKTIRVHDGTTPGGTMLARQSALDAADYVVAWQVPTDENNHTWYRKYKSGWVEQGGSLATAPTSEESTITFPLAFTDTNYYANRTLNYYVASNDWAGYGGGVVYDKTTTTMKFRHKGSVSWYASGFCAQ